MRLRLTLTACAPLLAAVAALVALTATGCTLPEDTASDSGGGSASGDGGGGGSNPCDGCTPAQEQAFTAAQGYLDSGIGFSRTGLIDQLTAEAGNGFAQPDAAAAVNKLAPNYRQQAVQAAQGYVDSGIGFSRDSLIEQLTSPAGNQFTQEQAAFAADKVGLN